MAEDRRVSRTTYRGCISWRVTTETKGDSIGPPPYEWAFLRQWLVTFLRAFLEFAEKPASREAWEGYLHALDFSLGEPLDLTRLKGIPDERVFYIWDEICSEIDEAYDKREVPPGKFTRKIEDAVNRLLDRLRAWFHIEDPNKNAPLRGMFDDAVARSRAWLRLLEESDDIEKVANEVFRIEREMSGD